MHVERVCPTLYALNLKTKPYSLHLKSWSQAYCKQQVDASQTFKKSLHPYMYTYIYIYRGQKAKSWSMTVLYPQTKERRNTSTHHPTSMVQFFWDTTVDHDCVRCTASSCPGSRKQTESSWKLRRGSATPRRLRLGCAVMVQRPW